jgi:hypothetical protein
VPKKRNVKTLLLAPVLHIYCEGEKTEPNYLKKYIQRQFGSERGRDVVRVESTNKNTPIQLVEVAIKHKNSRSCPDGDEFWVVYDRESVAKYAHALHATARNSAEANGINIALSNVCFELWILLHFKKNTACYSSYDDLISNSALKKELAKIGIANYEKGSLDLFAMIAGGVGSARDRAVAMNLATQNSAPPGATAPHLLNPYTDMHLLLDAIDDFPA